ncbi:putative periplasmic binding protein-like I [Rosa chinensis]|uniref:Putative periplasmic binding protein-like I n=1 Tax=Rosa chinensis TaxID=74649 RepID=A0A2P6QTR6_ROSCH|nr:putative periplasmic binding protein-like I [Rosa chinensis]
MANNNQYLLIIFMLLDVCLIYGNSSAVGEDGTGRKSEQMVNVGIILDLGTPVGKTSQRCISMALSEVYARNANYRTKLNLTLKDSRNDVVSAASAPLELLNNEEVQPIVGPQTSSQAKFVTSLGEKAQIPIISFSATSPSLSPTMNCFFIRTALDDSSQVKAITSIVKAYGWHEVVLIYEDTEYGNVLIPYIIDAFQQIALQKCYFPIIQSLKHFEKAYQVNGSADEGMMREGYASIITDGLSSGLHPLEGKVIDSMEGVVGVTPYVPMSTGLNDFEIRWKQSTIGTTKQTHCKISIFGLWAYDTVWALAEAVELIELQANYSSALKNNNKGKRTGGILSQIGVSKSGPRLLQTLLRTRFEGLSGRFRLIDQQFQPAAFQIFDVMSKRERVIGYWTPNKESF